MSAPGSTVGGTGLIARIFGWRGHSWLALSVRLYLGSVFLFACYHKIIDPGTFAIDVDTYAILPLDTVNLVALVLPWIELAAGLMLVLGLRTRAGALLVAGMMAVFTLAVAIALAKGIDISCGCFASKGDPISRKTLARDLSWLLLALYVLAVDRCPVGLDRLLSKSERSQ